MQKDDIQFNLTDEMTDYIIEINELKKQLIELEDKISIVDNEKDKLKIEKKKEDITKKIEKFKRCFIKSFQKNNKEQIKLYLNMQKD